MKITEQFTKKLLAIELVEYLVTDYFLEIEKDDFLTMESLKDLILSGELTEEDLFKQFKKSVHRYFDDIKSENESVLI